MEIASSRADLAEILSVTIEVAANPEGARRFRITVPADRSSEPLRGSVTVRRHGERIFFGGLPDVDPASVFEEFDVSVTGFSVQIEEVDV